MKSNKHYFWIGLISIILSFLILDLYFFIDSGLFIYNKKNLYRNLFISVFIFVLGVSSLIISIYKRLRIKGEGVSFSFKIKSLSIQEFFQIINPILYNLRDLSYEHLLLEIEDNQSGILFIQTAKYDKVYLLEIGILENNQKKLYRLKDLSFKQVRYWFYEVCVLKSFPDFSKWEDVSHIIKK